MSTSYLADKNHYVYRIFDRTGRLIYVGCSHDPETRMYTHRRIMWWAPQIARIKMTVHPSKDAGHLTERSIIDTENPRWNVKGKWANRNNWSRDDAADYLKALTLHPDAGGDFSDRRIRMAQEFLATFHPVAA